MTNKFSDKVLTIILIVALMPIITIFCMLWAVMTVGGGIVKRILGKHSFKMKGR